MSARSYYDYDMQKQEEEAEVQDLLARERTRRKWISIVLCIVAFMVFLAQLPEKKTSVVVGDFAHLPEPVQTAASGGITKKVDDVNVTIHFVASYLVQARVLDTQKYYDFNIFNKLGPVDVGLGWDYMATDYEKLKFVSAGNRFLRYTTDDIKWYTSKGGEEGITRYWSNNHLIPENAYIGKLIKQIKVGDCVQIEGYLGWLLWN